jgi:uncharacterized membrane protein
MDFMLRLLGRTDTGDHDWVAAVRLGVAAAVGAVALAVALAAGASDALSVSVGFDAEAFTFLGLVWLAIAGRDATSTERLARTEDSSRATSDIVLVSTGLASLVSIGFLLVAAGRGAGPADWGLVFICVLGIVLQWFTVHTVFLLAYARLYYGPPRGGIGFSGDDPPDYYDFAYLALTIGMTYQVSDTDLTAKPVRRTAIRHALLSYVYGALIVAVTINLIGSLLSK